MSASVPILSKLDRKLFIKYIDEAKDFAEQLPDTEGPYYLLEAVLDLVTLTKHDADLSLLVQVSPEMREVLILEANNFLAGNKNKDYYGSPLLAKVVGVLANHSFSMLRFSDQLTIYRQDGNKELRPYLTSLRDEQYLAQYSAEMKLLDLLGLVSGKKLTKKWISDCGHVSFWEDGTFRSAEMWNYDQLTPEEIEMGKNLYKHCPALFPKFYDANIFLSWAAADPSMFPAKAAWVYHILRLPAELRTQANMVKTLWGFVYGRPIRTLPEEASTYIKATQDDLSKAKMRAAASSAGYHTERGTGTLSNQAHIHTHDRFPTMVDTTKISGTRTRRHMGFEDRMDEWDRGVFEMFKPKAKIPEEKQVFFLRGAKPGPGIPYDKSPLPFEEVNQILALGGLIWTP